MKSQSHFKSFKSAKMAIVSVSLLGTAVAHANFSMNVYMPGFAAQNQSVNPGQVINKEDLLVTVNSFQNCPEGSFVLKSREITTTAKNPLLEAPATWELRPTSVGDGGEPIGFPDAGRCVEADSLHYGGSLDDTSPTVLYYLMKDGKKTAQFFAKLKLSGLSNCSYPLTTPNYYECDFNF